MGRIGVYKKEKDPSYGGMCPKCHEVFGHVRNGHCPKCKRRLLSQEQQTKMFYEMLKEIETK